MYEDICVNDREKGMFLRLFYLRTMQSMGYTVHLTIPGSRFKLSLLSMGKLRSVEEIFP